MSLETQADQLKAEMEQLQAELQDTSILSTKEGQAKAKRLAELMPLVELAAKTHKLKQQRAEVNDMLKSDDLEMAKLAAEEAQKLDNDIAISEQELEEALIPADPNNDKNAIIEIRAGAGGDEASLFAGELYRMYTLFSEKHSWQAELISESPSEVGGFKEIIFKLNGQGVFGKLKYESGVHRVQRIPATESGGRIHTSTATVAVLPEAEETDIEINPSDLRIDVFRSSGPGGQSVNTTDSAVRVTHVPTGIIVTCQDEKSQHKNKAKALSVLRSRLLAAKLEEEQKARSDQRRAQIGSGDRSEKIRTYNFPQDRVTDHRIKVSLKNLPGIMNGQIDELIEKLQSAERELQKN